MKQMIPNVDKYTSPMDPMGEWNTTNVEIYKYVFQVCFTSWNPIFRLETFDNFWEYFPMIR